MPRAQPELVARLVRAAARQRGAPVPRRSTIRAALRDANLSPNARGWSRDDAARFLAALFPDRTAATLRRGADGRTLLEERRAPSAAAAAAVAAVLPRPPSPAAPAAPRMYERTVETAHLVSIDSADRDRTRFADPNDFTIQLGRSDTTGLLRAFVDVAAVELVSVVVPKHTVDGDNVDDFPYLLLEVPELGGIYEGTNMHTTRAFAKLRFADDLGAYREYRTTDAGERFVKRFEPVRSVDRLTVRFRRPDGQLYDFGTRVKRRPRYAVVTTPSHHHHPKPGECATKKTPMYFDGDRWRAVVETGSKRPDDDDDASDASDEGGEAEPEPEPPTVLDDLPLSECYIVLRFTCVERRLRTSHLHRG